MTRNEAIQIAIMNANEAFDQAHEFDSLDEAISSYRDNMQDSLVEKGILKNTKTKDQLFIAAETAFDKHIAKIKRA